MVSTQFPDAADVYHTIDNNQGMQLKVVRFLVVPHNIRDVMLSDFGWAWRQVKPPVDIFKKDVSVLAFHFSHLQLYTKELSA